MNKFVSGSTTRDIEVKNNYLHSYVDDYLLQVWSTEKYNMMIHNIRNNTPIWNISYNQTSLPESIQNIPITCSVITDIYNIGHRIFYSANDRESGFKRILKNISNYKEHADALTTLQNKIKREEYSTLVPISTKLRPDRIHITEKGYLITDEYHRRYNTINTDIIYTNNISNILGTSVRKFKIKVNKLSDVKYLSLDPNTNESVFKPIAELYDVNKNVLKIKKRYTPNTDTYVLRIDPEVIVRKIYIKIEYSNGVIYNEDTNTFSIDPNVTAYTNPIGLSVGTIGYNGFEITLTKNSYTEYIISVKKPDRLIDIDIVDHKIDLSNMICKISEVMIL